jgi:hypothetical protein
MGGRFGLVVLGAFGVLLAGFFVVWVAQGRVDQDRVYCANHLRQLGRFAAHHVKPDEKAGGSLPTSIPAGTVVVPDLRPDRRLSWVPDLLPALDSRRQATADLAARIDKNRPWDAETNAAAARTTLSVLTCPANPPPETGGPAVTQYVGSGGVNPAGATLPPTDPRAGAFRYDAPTPFAALTDGLSHTLLFAETNAALGPWLAGGPATVRGYDDASRPAIGAGGQFGGNHFGGGNFGFADGSARFLSDRIAGDVFRNLVTIAGGTDAPIPGE